MRREEQLTTEQYKKICANILYVVFCMAILVVLCLDMFVWRPN